MLLRALFATLLLGTAARASEPATVATFPNGTFLENLAPTPAGELLITSYMDKRLLGWAGEGAPRTVAELPAHPVGILARGDRVVVSAHAVPLTAGPAFLSSNQLLVLDARGTLLRTVAAPEARFLNGLVELPSGLVLAADSVAGRIWRFDPGSGELRPWLDHPSLAADPKRPQLPGANGLKLRDGWLYVSNSALGALSRVRLAGDGADGTPELVARTGAIDDFAFLPDGSIAAATHGDKLIRVAADGTITDILADGCDGCTSVALDRRTGKLIVLTTGKLLEGGKGTAKILAVPAP